MNRESNRLATFASWPSHFPVDVKRLARGGFFANGRQLEVECHWCRQSISDWRYGDQVMTRHRQLDPLCPFITDPLVTDNVPTLETELELGTGAARNHALDEPPPPPPSADSVEEPDNRGGDAGATESSTDTSTTEAAAAPATNGGGNDEDEFPDYLNEQCRLNTFTNWPITCVTPRSLARAGFYYYNQSDHVRCAWCQGVIAKWEQGDDPHTEHSKFFPQCPRAMCGPNVRMLDANASTGAGAGAGTSASGEAGHHDHTNPADIAAIGIQPHQPSRHEAFASLDFRLQSFSRWPPAAVQRPEQLAAAGFFYLDDADYVRCFHCSGGLRSWQPDDDPWVEHAKYFPRCGFVELVRGRAFVHAVQEALHRSRNGGAAGAGGSGEPRLTVELELVMGGGWPRKALEMGFAEEDVRKVVAQRLEITGAEYEGIDELVVAILSLKVAEAEMGVEAETAAVVQEVRTSPTATDAEHATTTATTEEEGAGAVGGTATAVRRPSTALAPGEGSSSLKAILSGSVGRTVSLEDENRKLKDAILCKVCMVEEVGIVFLPCGHLVSCVQCASSVAACPLCRTQIKAYVRTYLS